MLRRFRWLALGAMVTTAALVGPSIARADDPCKGATSIYSEQCSVPKVTGHHSTTKKPATHPAPYHWTPTPVQPVTPPAQVPHEPTHKPTHTHPEKTKPFLKNPGLGYPGLGYSARLDAERVSAPATSLSSAMDLGTGPTILFVLLLGAVIGTLGAGGFRAWRNRHHA